MKIKIVLFSFVSRPRIMEMSKVHGVFKFDQLLNFMNDGKPMK